MDFLEFIFALVSAIMDAIRKRQGPSLHFVVGWIAGVIAILILALNTCRGCYNTTSDFGSLLALTFFLSFFGGTLGGLLGGRLAKDSTLAGQIVSAAFFGAFLGVIPGLLCIIATQSSF
jgi:hypothetical protein